MIPKSSAVFRHLYFPIRKNNTWKKSNTVEEKKKGEGESRGPIRFHRILFIRIVRSNSPISRNDHPVSRERVSLPRNQFARDPPQPLSSGVACSAPGEVIPSSKLLDVVIHVYTCVDGWFFRLRADFIAATIVFRPRYHLLRGSSSWSPWTWPRFVGVIGVMPFGEQGLDNAVC